MDESEQCLQDSARQGVYAPSKLMLARRMQWIHFVAYDPMKKPAVTVKLLSLPSRHMAQNRQTEVISRKSYDITCRMAPSFPAAPIARKH